jgi:methionyl-tRNA formyltransferase
VFAGTPAFAVPAFEALVQSDHEIVGVLTQPDRPRGRGQRVAASAVKGAAQAHGLNVSQPGSLRSDAVIQELKSLRADVLVVVAYGLLLPRQVLDVPRLGSLNIHASLLPRWRGAAPIQRALLAGDTTTGVTIMLMDAGLDTGPILLQRAIDIEAEETAGALQGRLASLGAQALVETLDRWPRGDLAPEPQPSTGVTLAPRIDKTEALIDWTQDAERLDRQVRAFNPWPIAETRFDGEQLRIHRARRVEPGAAAAGLTPGQVMSADASGVKVQCGRGRLLLLELQRPGGRVLAARDVANSLPLLGRALGS